MGLFEVRHAQAAQPRPRGAGVVEEAAEAGDVHSGGQGSGAGGQGKPPHCVRRARRKWYGCRVRNPINCTPPRPHGFSSGVRMAMSS